MKKTDKKQMLKGVFLALAFAFGVFVWSSDSVITLAATKAKVVASSGKIREKADKNSEAIGSAKKGDSLEVIDSSNDSEGYTWYKVYVSGDTTGYIRGDLVSIQEEGSTGGGTTTVVGSNNRVTVEEKEETAAPATDVAVNATDVATVKTTSDVRVRKGPGTNYDVAGSAKKNTEAAVSGIAPDSSGKNWYQVSINADGKTTKGFIREDLVEITAHVEAPAEPVPETPVEEAPPAEAPVVENQDYQLQYMQNDAGNMDWYLFDNVHGTKQSLTQLLNAVEQIRENELTEAKQVSTMRIIMIALAAGVVILIIVVTVLILKLRDAYEYEYEDDDEEDEEDDEEDEDEEDDDEDDEEETTSRKPRFGFLKKKEVVEEDEEEFDEEDEEETLKEIQPPKQEKSKKPENKAWQSKDFLELDDDMEFEFLDL